MTFESTIVKQKIYAPNNPPRANFKEFCLWEDSKASKISGAPLEKVTKVIALICFEIQNFSVIKLIMMLR